MSTVKADRASKPPCAAGCGCATSSFWAPPCGALLHRWSTSMIRGIEKSLESGEWRAHRLVVTAAGVSIQVASARRAKSQALGLAQRAERDGEGDLVADRPGQVDGVVGAQSVAVVVGLGLVQLLLGHFEVHVPFDETAGADEVGAGGRPEPGADPVGDPFEGRFGRDGAPDPRLADAQVDVHGPADRPALAGSAHEV